MELTTMYNREYLIWIFSQCIPYIEYSSDYFNLLSLIFHSFTLL